MLIFVEQISTRLIYVFDFIFKERNLFYQFTNDKKEFSEYQGIKFSYTDNKVVDSFHFHSSDLLFSEEIKYYTIEESSYYDQLCIKFNNVADPFSSIFFVLSRYEEYIIKKRDEHGRFMAIDSYQYKFNCLEFCICDRWAELILKILNENICTFYTKIENNIEIIPTFDIDNTFAFKWKNKFRSQLSKLRDIYKKDKNRLIARKKFEKNLSEDPYDTFDKIKEIQKKYNTKIFWHVGKYSQYDKNISIFNPNHQNLIKEMSIYGEIGIHPSYKSSENHNILANEIDSLSVVLNKQILNSRQHFLRLNIPTTYRNLIDFGIKNDYSMGYADHYGFRIGTARSIKFFDLFENKIKDLWIHPFVYMDGTILEYKNLTIEEAKNTILKLFKEVKNYGGKFTFIWHNETIGDFDKWNGWSEVLNYTLELNKNEI